jgi:HlyD family secretion protein
MSDSSNSPASVAERGNAEEMPGLEQRHDMVPTPHGLPTPIPRERRLPAWRRIVVLLVIVAGAVGGGLYWLNRSNNALPVGIVSGNGRIEADEIDIATKFAGRVTELLADEGTVVTAGQVVARMDTRDLQASLQKAQSQMKQAQRVLDEARAIATQQQTQFVLAQQELDRTQSLLKNGFATQELFDQRRQRFNFANAALHAANARVEQAEHAVDAARHDVDLLQINIADNALIAPRDGRIQYRMANIGEVLPAGGKVFTMLELNSVYMDIYVPTADVGRARIGYSARIVLDAYPKLAIPAKVSFISDQAQFRPKAVETKSERDKLMFRVRVRVDPERLRAHREAVKSGVPGVALCPCVGRAANSVGVRPLRLVCGRLVL